LVVALLFSSVGIKPEHKQPQNSDSRILIELSIESNEFRLRQYMLTSAILTKAVTKT
jgi:hypothetical protein